MSRSNKIMIMLCLGVWMFVAYQVASVLSK